jgi:hypothetical protein
MNTPSRLIKLSLTLSLLAAPAFADVGGREVRQQERIEQGVRTGELNRHETNRLERQEGRVSREVSRDRREGGGRLDRQERGRITAQQNHLSREIYREKHDRR